MTSAQNLYSALGKIIYGIAGTSSHSPKEEEELLQKIVRSELNKQKRLKETSIIFSNAENKTGNVEENYKTALKIMEQNSHSLSPLTKALFIAIVKKVAAVFPPVTIESQNIADRFAKDIDALDPGK